MLLRGLILVGDYLLTGADRVTDPAFSEELYTKASSTDKTFKKYEGMWHAILAEPDGGADLVRGDIAAWVNERIGGAAVASAGATTTAEASTAQTDDSVA